MAAVSVCGEFLGEELEEGCEDWETGEDDLAEWLAMVGVCKCIRLTPTFISMFPHSTNIVEFPLPLAMTGICVILMMEQTVVKVPRQKMPITPIFLWLSICSAHRSGIGKKKIKTSNNTIMEVRPKLVGPNSGQVPTVFGLQDL